VGEAIAAHAECVQRMAAFAQAQVKPLTLRTFVKRASGLYAEAKLSADAMEHLRQDDPFLLEFRDPNALVTRSALLRVHQLEPTKEIAWFRVQAFVGAEMEHLDALAERQEVPGKGYTARPVCDLTQYAGLDLTNLGRAVRILMIEAHRLQD
jgi:hypothetical protein